MIYLSNQASFSPPQLCPRSTSLSIFRLRCFTADLLNPVGDAMDALSIQSMVLSIRAGLSPLNHQGKKWACLPHDHSFLLFSMHAGYMDRFNITYFLWFYICVTAWGWINPCLYSPWATTKVWTSVSVSYEKYIHTVLLWINRQGNKLVYLSTNRCSDLLTDSQFKRDKSLLCGVCM